MKWVKKKWKQLSSGKKIVGFILTGILIILILTAGLRIWDKKNQKPRLLSALSRLLQATCKEEYTFEPFFAVLQDGKTQQDGYVNLTAFQKDFPIWNKLLFGQTDMTSSTIHYQIQLDQEKNILWTEKEYQLAKIGTLDVESYLTKEKLIVRIPQLHESYLRMDTQNIKTQYENSLLYKVLENRFSVPEIDFSSLVFQPFPQSRADQSKEENRFAAFLKEYEKNIVPLWKQITVTREEGSKQILINGIYENCRVFHLTFPADLIHWYFDYTLPSSQTEQLKKWINWEEKEVTMLVYMDDENHIHQIETTIIVCLLNSDRNTKADSTREKTVYPIKMTLSLKGEENLLDNLQLKVQIETKPNPIILLFDMKNKYTGTERKWDFLVSQTEPTVQLRVRAELIMNVTTGESHIEYEINTPILTSDGEHHIKRLEQPIKEPAGEIVDIFDLDLIEFMKFSKDFNFDLFQ